MYIKALYWNKSGTKYIAPIRVTNETTVEMAFKKINLKRYCLNRLDFFRACNFSNTNYPNSHHGKEYKIIDNAVYEITYTYICNA